MVWPASKKQRICAPSAEVECLLSRSAPASLHGSKGRERLRGCAVAARVKNALISVCQEQGDLHSTLHMRYGIEIEEASSLPESVQHMCLQAARSTPGSSLLLVQVRMAPDNLTAYVLWDAFPGPAREAAAELERL